MIDGKKLEGRKADKLKSLTYQEQVILWDIHCVNCPHSICGVKFPNKTEVIITDSYQDAIDMLMFPEYKGSNGSLMRGCNFNDEFMTLAEICINTCRFWGNAEMDEYEDHYYCEEI